MPPPSSCSVVGTLLQVAPAGGHECRAALPGTPSHGFDPRPPQGEWRSFSCRPTLSCPLSVLKCDTTVSPSSAANAAGTTPLESSDTLRRGRRRIHHTLQETFSRCTVAGCECRSELHPLKVQVAGSNPARPAMWGGSSAVEQEKTFRHLRRRRRRFSCLCFCRSQLAGEQSPEARPVPNPMRGWMQGFLRQGRGRSRG